VKFLNELDGEGHMDLFKPLYSMIILWYANPQ